MATTQTKTIVEGMSEVEGKEVKRTRRFLLFFKTEWWEVVSSKTLGNDIHIKTDREIRDVYLNGEKLI